MTAVWVATIALALATAVLKLIGPLLLGGRRLPAGMTSVIAMLASALLAALVVVETFTHDKSLTLDARALGVGVAAIALALRASLMAAVLGAAVVTAGARALF